VETFKDPDFKKVKMLDDINFQDVGGINPDDEERLSILREDDGKWFLDTWWRYYHLKGSTNQPLKDGIKILVVVAHVILMEDPKRNDSYDLISGRTSDPVENCLQFVPDRITNPA
jgi:hypothetical protein